MNEMGGIEVVEGEGEVSDETVGVVTAEEADCVLLLLLWTKAIL